MIDGDDTTATEIEGAADGIFVSPPWQSERREWSFGSATTRLFAPVDLEARSPLLELTANAEDAATAGPQSVVVPDYAPASPPRFSFGKRGLEATHQWEGVVEEVANGSFRARLLPLINGRPDHARVEYTEFSLGDLANEDDRDLVTEGAVFYWSVGKGKNRAGTVTNVSLVRFKRVPRPGPYQERIADSEATALIEQLGGDPSN